jgi:hypothetical protein
MQALEITTIEGAALETHPTNLSVSPFVPVVRIPAFIFGSTAQLFGQKEVAR